MVVEELWRGRAVQRERRRGQVTVTVTVTGMDPVKGTGTVAIWLPLQL